MEDYKVNFYLRYLTIIIAQFFILYLFREVINKNVELILGVFAIFDVLLLVFALKWKEKRMHRIL